MKHFKRVHIRWEHTNQQENEKNSSHKTANGEIDGADQFIQGVINQLVSQ